jgi:hypothetical protein
MGERFGQLCFATREGAIQRAEAGEHFERSQVRRAFSIRESLVQAVLSDFDVVSAFGTRLLQHIILFY